MGEPFISLFTEPRCGNIMLDDLRQTKCWHHWKHHLVLCWEQWPLLKDHRKEISPVLTFKMRGSGPCSTIQSWHFEPFLFFNHTHTCAQRYTHMQTHTHTYTYTHTCKHTTKSKFLNLETNLRFYMLAKFYSDKEINQTCFGADIFVNFLCKFGRKL